MDVDEELHVDSAEEGEEDAVEEPVLNTQEEREQFYKELLKAREVERATAIKEGKLDDPNVPKRLEDAITIVGTCKDMCPRFERYRRERENNLFNWEVIPGTKRVDHKKAVKMYERGAGDKIVPSDLRPPHVLKRTLNYLFRELIPAHGFGPTFAFVRDRTRSVRNDFTMQHEMGPLAMECHERCARFHILALHLQRDSTGFSGDLEEQQLMNTLQSLKEFYSDQRGRYESPNELEMRIYHRLTHLRDQRERHDGTPIAIQNHPVFLLTTRFREHVQKISSPIRKKSPLKVDQTAMQIFGELAGVLSQQGNAVMVYLVACILEWHFGKDTIEDIESIRGDMDLPDIIDGVLSDEEHHDIEEVAEVEAEAEDDEEQNYPTEVEPSPASFGVQPGLTNEHPNGSAPAFAPSAFSGLTSSPFGKPASAFSLPGPSHGSSAFASADGKDAFGRPISAFGGTFGSTATNAQNVQPPTQPTEKPKPSSIFSSPFNLPQQSAKTSGSPPVLSGLNPNANVFTPAAPFPVAAPAPPASISIPQAPAQTPTSNAQDVPTSNSAISRRPLLTPLATTPFPPAPLSGASTASVSAQQSQPLKTDASFNNNAQTATSTPSKVPSPSVPSPMLPDPPTPKVVPVSLPSTPTGTFYESPVKTTKPISLFSSLTFSQSSQDGMLSPLNLTGPSFSRASFGSGPASPASLKPSTGTPTLARRTSYVDSPLRNSTIHPQNGTTSDLPSPTPKIDKGKQKAIEVDIEKEDDPALVAKADAYILRRPFRTWSKKAADRIEYSRAIKRSEEYRKHRRRASVSSTASESSASVRKQRESLVEVDAELASVRRVRRRTAGKFVPPRTDEELAKRLQENHEQHARRWAKGSFLQVARNVVENRAGTSPFDWSIWMSLNESSDGTAIWIENKFDVPESGHWLSEKIFSIPLNRSASDASSPGLIVFECTPSGGVDEVERKYRALDDYARLKNIIESLPDNRYYIPSLLLIVWSEDDKHGLPNELEQEIMKNQSEAIFQSYTTLFLSSTSTDLDEKFTSALQVLNLDVLGGLAEVLSAAELVDIVFAPYKEFAVDWATRALSDGEVDWVLVGHVLQTSIELLNCMSRHFTTHTENENLRAPLPPLSLSVESSESVYDAISLWLNGPNLRDISHHYLAEMQSSRSSGMMFPVDSFIAQLQALASRRMLSEIDGSGQQYTISQRDLNVIKQDVQKDVLEAAEKLRRVFAFHIRPKRRPDDDGQPSSHRTNKKLKTSSSTVEEVLVNGNGHENGATRLSVPQQPSPSPTPAPTPSSIADDSPPKVTIAMLRALSKSVLKARP